MTSVRQAIDQATFLPGLLDETDQCTSVRCATANSRWDRLVENIEIPNQGSNSSAPGVGYTATCRARNALDRQTVNITPERAATRRTATYFRVQNSELPGHGVYPNLCSILRCVWRKMLPGKREVTVGKTRHPGGQLRVSCVAGSWGEPPSPATEIGGGRCAHCGGVLLDGRPCGPTGASPGFSLRQQPLTMSPCGKLTCAE